MNNWKKTKDNLNKMYDHNDATENDHNGSGLIKFCIGVISGFIIGIIVGLII